MIPVNEILEIVQEQPILLQQTGKILNTWRLILGQSTIPKFYIYYMEAITDTNELVTLGHFDMDIGYDEDGTPYSTSNIVKIHDMDATVTLDNSYLTDLYLIEDVLYYPKEHRYVTLSYLFNSKTEPIYINSLPLFDHTKIKYNFNGKIVIGLDSYSSLLQSINYMNCQLKPDKNGMVKIVYETEVPYTVFYSKKVNEELSETIPGIPLVKHAFAVSLD